jgi:hypothetical protein
MGKESISSYGSQNYEDWAMSLPFKKSSPAPTCLSIARVTENKAFGQSLDVEFISITDLVIKLRMY